MGFEELVTKVNELETEKENVLKKQVVEIVDKIDINPDNFNNWVQDIFSEKIEKFDMYKIAFLIDKLYQTDNKQKFLLCCMLLEATCDKLKFITPLERYEMFEAKFQTLTDTLVTVYGHVDSPIANCMSLIILNNDPEYKFFSDEQKGKLVEATVRKLNDIINYLKENKGVPEVYNDMEIIIDMACYLKNEVISTLVDQLDQLGDNGKADIFIMKYKVINNMDISTEKITKIIEEKENLEMLYSVMERLGANEKYLGNVTQEMIAESAMIKWLVYPTELGSMPDKLELLGEFMFNDKKCYAYKFSKEDFSIFGDLLGIVGGYETDKITARNSGYTFSKFDTVEEDWKKQAEELAAFIYDHWKSKLK